MSDTPITDAAEMACRAYANKFNELAKQPGGVVMTIPDPNAPPDGWAIARQLERELSAAESKVDALERLAAINNWVDDVTNSDEAEEIMCEFNNEIGSIAHELADTRAKVDALMREKEQAFAALALAAENEAGLNELLRDAVREKEELIERCAKVCDGLEKKYDAEGDAMSNGEFRYATSRGAEECAVAIRALVREQQNTTQEDLSVASSTNHPSIEGG